MFLLYLNIISIWRYTCAL